MDAGRSVWKVDWLSGSTVQFTNYTNSSAVVVVNDWVLALLLSSLPEDIRTQVYGSLHFCLSEPSRDQYCIRLVVDFEGSSISASYQPQVFDMVLVNFPELTPVERGEFPLPN